MTKDQAMLVKTSLALALITRAARLVVDNWESRHLADAVHALEADIETADDVFKEAEEHQKHRSRQRDRRRKS